MAIDSVLGSTGTTSSVSIGGSVTGTIDANGDQDWYEVTLVAGQQYRFDLEGLSSGEGTLSDPYLRLLNSAGTQIAFNDDSGGSLDSSITFTASASGTYYLSAQAYLSSTGTFRLSATNITGGAGDIAANTGTSGTVAVDGSVAGTIGASGDQDWYAVNLEAGHQYRFDLRGVSSGEGTLADPVLRLLDSGGTEIVANDDTTGSLDSRITFTASSSGTYYLSAQSFGSGIGTFTLSATDLFSDGPDNVAATTNTGGSITAGNFVNGTVDAGGDQDWYAVTLTAGHQYRFDLRGFDSGLGTLGDPVLRLLNSSGNEIAINDDSAGTLDSRITYTPTQSGTYFLSAQGFSDSAGTFRLSATDLGGGVDTVPGSTGSDVSVAVGGSRRGTINASGDQDWYRVSLVAGHEYRFDLGGFTSGQGTLTDPLLRLRDVSGNVIRTNDDSEGTLDSSIAYTATTTGFYYLAAQGYGSSTGTFTLRVTELTGGAGEVPASTGTGSAVAVGGTMSGTIETTGDQDWYRVTLESGHQYRFDLRAFDSDLGTLDDPYLRLLSSSGAEIKFNDDSGLGLESRITFTASVSGTYYLSAEAYAGYGIGTFVLSATDLTGGAGDVPGNTNTTAEVFVGGSISGTIGTANDRDYYEVALVAGRQYRFDLAGFDSGQGTLTDPLLRLLNASGTLIDTDDDSGYGLESTITYTPTQSGTYYLSAQAYQGYTTGTFVLSVTDESVDVPATTGTGRWAVLGGQVEGTIEVGGDQDWYRVSLIEGHRYAFDLQGANFGLGTLDDPLLRVLDDLGIDVALDDDSGGGFDANIVFTAGYTGTYFLAAQGYGTATGTFTLSAFDFDDPGDVPGDIDTGRSIAIGGSTTGRIDTGGDQDWYQISLVSGHLYRFDVQGADSNNGSLTDPVLRLLDSTGVELFLNDDSFGTHDSVIGLTETLGNTYFLSVEGFEYSTGTYTVTATDLTAVAGDVPANASTTAGVPVDGFVTGLINGNEGTYDDDWYRVTLAQGHTYRFDLQGASLSWGTLTNPYLALYDGTGAFLQADFDSGPGNDSRITFTPGTPGTYFLSAGGESLSDIGSFTLFVTDLSGAGDPPAGTASTRRVFTGTAVNGAISSSTDQDSYRIALTAGHEYLFDLQGFDSGLGTLSNPLLRLLDSSGELVVSDNNSGIGLDSLITYTATASGTYFLSAEGGNSSTGTFEMLVTDLTLGAGDVLGGRATNSVVGVGGSVAGTIDAGGDQDWYQVSLIAGHEYHFDLRGVASEVGTLVDPYLRLIDGSGLEVGFDDDSGAGLESSITYVPGASGIYFLSAEGFGTGTGTYVLSAFDGDIVLGNTGTDSAIAVGGSVTGAIDVAGDQDYYRVELLAGHRYRFDLAGLDSDQGTLADPYLRLINGAGFEIVFNDDGGVGRDSRITYTITESGYYYVSAQGFDGLSAGTYTLNAVDLSSDDVPANTSTADVLYRAGGTIEGTIDAIGDQDWYRVTLVAGRDYSFDLLGAASGRGTLADPVLRLLDGSGMQIDFSDNAGTADENIPHFAVASGTYYLSVEGWSSNTGTFTLVATDLDAGDVPPNTGTNAVVAIDSSVSGSIAAGGDRDWYQVTLVSGHQYRFDLQALDSGAGTLADPYLELHDSGGGFIAFDDDSGPGLEPSLIYNAGASGVYYLEVSDYDLSLAGTFVLTATDLTGGTVAERTLEGTGGADTLTGSEFDDSVQGFGSDDQLDGKGGDDTLIGGNGNDALGGGLGDDSVMGGPGNDIFLQVTVESAGNDTLLGSSGDDIFHDHFGDNVLDGGADADLFVVYIADAGGTNLVTGGDGQDIYQLQPRTVSTAKTSYVVTDFEVGSGGDLLDVNALLDASAEARFFVAGTSDVSDFVRLMQSGPDTLLQWDRDGTGATYDWKTYLNLKNIEADKVESDNFRGAVDVGTKLADDLNGTQGNDLLAAADGNDTLDGGIGMDVMAGGNGSDLYYVDDIKDVVLESIDALPPGALAGFAVDAELWLLLLAAADDLTDTVIALIDYSLQSVEYVENITLEGTTATEATGNELNNVITGNTIANRLSGLAGNDTLSGLGGADTLLGGGGNDTYVVNNVSDVVTEGSGKGTDLVQASVTLTGALAANVENLRLTGTGNLNATGNGLANILYANTGDNVLSGGADADTVSYEFGASAGVTVSLAVTTMQATGGSGSDRLTGIERLTGSSYADRLTGSSGNNVLAGSGGNDTVVGGGGYDTLAGGAGNDTLTGGGGADKFNFNTALNVTTNVDRITDFVGGTDLIQLDDDIFTALVTGNLAAGAFRQGAGITAAGDAGDRIIYNTNNGNLYYDADGAGGTAAKLFATLTGAPAVTAADFFTVA